jgi:hypothetical protein
MPARLPSLIGAVPGLGTFNQLGSSDESRDWLENFLNHVEQNQTQRNPNTGISVRPTAAGVHAQI